MEFKELRNIAATNDKSFRDDMQNMGTKLSTQTREMGAGLHADWKAAVSKSDTQLLRLAELIAETKGQFRYLALVMAPMVVAICIYLVW